MTALSTIDGTRPSDYSLTVSTDSMSALDPSRLSGQRFLDVQSTISAGKGSPLSVGPSGGFARVSTGPQIGSLLIDQEGRHWGEPQSLLGGDNSKL